MRAALRIATTSAGLLLAGCALFARPSPEPAPLHAGDERAASVNPSLEQEEADLEGLGEESPGGDPIAAFIAAYGASTGDPAPVETARETPPISPPGAAPAPTAAELWDLSDEACRTLLDSAGIAVSVPDFETPFVRQPLLLDGPVDGVVIRPNWRRPVRINEVMDCRLVVALRHVAAAARTGGFAEILFYSTYRPVAEPPEECPAGRDGKKCRAARDAWEKAKAGKASMHRRGLAIDIGWLTTADGEKVSVLDDYERHERVPPCDADAGTDLGRRLRDFACALHAEKAFNVVLTPNANRAHHNHFHLDITPGARWYIVR